MRGRGGKWRTGRARTRLAGAPWALVLAAAAVRCAGRAGEQVPVQAQKRGGVVADAGLRSPTRLDASVRAADATGTRKPRVVTICEGGLVSGTAILTDLPTAAPDLSAWAVRLCISDQCFDAPLPTVSGSTQTFGPWTADKQIGRVYLSTSARPFDHRRLALKIFVQLSQTPELTVDGTQYVLTILDPQRRQVFNVRRRVRYDHSADDGCGRVATATMTLTAKSRSGLECTGHTSGGSFEIRLPLPGALDTLAGSELTLCRNGLCSSGTLRDIDQVAGRITNVGGVMGGYVDAYWKVFTDEQHQALTVSVGGPTFEFGPADHYRLVLIEGRNPPRVLFDRRVTYVNSYPNGKACDDTPSRSVRVDLCKAGRCPGGSDFKCQDSTRRSRDAGLHDCPQPIGGKEAP